MALNGTRLILTAPGLRRVTGSDAVSEIYAYDGKQLGRLTGAGTAARGLGIVDCVSAGAHVAAFFDHNARLHLMDTASATMSSSIDTTGGQCPLAVTDGCVVINAAATAGSRPLALCRADGWSPRALSDAAQGLSIVVGRDDTVVGVQEGQAHLLTLDRHGSIDSDVAFSLPPGIPDTAALSNDTLAVRLRQGDTSSRIVLFRKHEGTWTQGALLESPTNAQKNSFGYALAISGDWMIVGDPVDNAEADKSGAAFVYSRHGQDWRLVRTIKDAGAPIGSMLGLSVVLTDEAVAFLAAPGSGSERGTGKVLEARLRSPGLEVSVLAP